MGTVKLELRFRSDSSAKPHCKYNVLNMKSNETSKMFNWTVKNKFSGLEFVDDDLSNHWTGLKQTWHESFDEVLEVWVIERNGCPKKVGLWWHRGNVLMNACNEQANKRDLASLYTQLNRDVR